MSTPSKNERIEEFLRTNYDFRYNAIFSQAEISCRGEKSFRVISRYDLNSLRRMVDQELGITTSADNIRTILESDFSPRVHPVKEYFNALPRLDPAHGGYLKRLAQTVAVGDDSRWSEYLTRWLVGVATNALDDKKCLNHLCLVLCGDQGKMKSQWLDHLCPQALTPYLYTGKIDPSPTNKDVLCFVAERLIINVDDQLRELNKQDENSLKNRITAPNVQFRRPYEVYPATYPHMASFCASVNGNDFLTDATGSRRFLPFEVLEIDMQSARNINMDHVFGEALFLLNSGFRYWFNDDEVAILHSESTEFQVQTAEYEMLRRYYVPSEDRADFITTAEILSHLRTISPLSLSEKRMGEALRKAGFQRVSQRVRNSPIYGYLAKRTL